MNSTTFPQSPESSKLGGTSSSPSSSSGSSGSSGGKATGMGMDPVGDSAGSRPMTSSADMGTSAQSPQGSEEAAKSRFTTMAHETVDKVADLAGRYATSPSKAMEASKTLMQDKPMVALGAAVALGLLLGRLTSR